MSVLVIRTSDGVADLAGAIPVLAAAAVDSRWDEVHVILPTSLVAHLHGLPDALVLHPVGEPVGEHEVLNRIGAEAALLLTSSFASALAVWRAGIPIRAGVQGGGLGFLLTHSVRQASVGGGEARTRAH